MDIRAKIVNEITGHKQARLSEEDLLAVKYLV